MEDSPDHQPEAVFPELTAKDTSKYATAFAQVVTASAVAVERGLISELLAVKIVAAVAGRLGVECDPEAELKAARKDNGRRAEDDLFTDPPDEEEEADEDEDEDEAA